MGEKEDVSVANEETTIATAKDTAVDTAVDTAGKVDEETECPICFERCELAGSVFVYSTYNFMYFELFVTLFLIN